ncbi:MAG: RNA polymerase sigma factor [Synoicihabitans sp.]
MGNSSDHDSLFNTWLEEHQGIVVKIARSFSANLSDFDELRQELLLRVWISAKTFTGQSKASTWIYRVCLNTAMSWRRSTDRRERRMDSSANLRTMKTDSISPADNLGDQEILEQLYTAIHALKPGDRALVLLSLDGLTYREMAEITGLSENHVGVVLTRARQRLGKLLKGITDELE